MAAPPLRMTPVEWGLLLGLSVIWGGSFFFVEIALREVPPFTVVLSRVAIGGAALYLVLRAGGRTLALGWPVWRIFFLLGLINNALPFCFLTWGQSRIDGGLASILNATTPLFTIVIAHFLTIDERMTPGRAAGVVVGFVGVAAMIGVDALNPLGADLAGQLSCLGAPVCYAIGTIQARRLSRLGLSPVQSAAGQFIAASVYLLPVSMALDRPWTFGPPSTETVAALAGLALVSSALAYMIYFRILATAGATNILLVTFLVPATAISLGILFLGEALQAQHVAGVALVGVGLALIDGRPFAVLRRR